MIEKYFHFEEGNVPQLGDILKNLSVSFVNAHHSLGYPKPNLPNVVNLGGLHFTPSKPLPKVRKFYFLQNKILQPLLIHTNYFHRIFKISWMELSMELFMSV